MLKKTMKLKQLENYWIDSHVEIHSLLTDSEGDQTIVEFQLVVAAGTHDLWLEALCSAEIILSEDFTKNAKIYLQDKTAIA